MFKIIPVPMNDLDKVMAYLGTDTKGMILACYEEEGITGAASVDISGGVGFFEYMKTDKPEMENVMGKSVLNFLELHGILDVYAKAGTNDEYFKSLGFKPAEKEENGWGLYLNLEGYFTHQH